MSSGSATAQMSSVDLIHAKQRLLKDIAKGKAAPAQQPTYKEFLHTLETAPDFALFGCIEPRLPIGDLGMKFGKAVASRVAGAFVGGYVPKSADAAAIAIAIKKGVRDIVVMGHTDCSAMDCCLKGLDHPDNEGLEDAIGYLEPLDEARRQIMGLGLNEKDQKHRLAEEAVRASLKNLEEYPVVKKAIAAGTVRLHGWVLDIDKALSDKPQPYLYELVGKDFKLMADVPWQMRVAPPFTPGIQSAVR